MGKMQEQDLITRDRLIAHYQKYNSIMLEDIFKYIFQSSFGCEHMISSLEFAINYIKREMATADINGDTLTEELDGEYSRVYLSWLKRGLTPETLGKLFVLSAKTESDGNAALEKKLQIARELVAEGVIPISLSEFDKAHEEWRSLNYPAIHHSERFRSEYAPAYRVISNKYVPFLPLLAKIDSLLENGRVILAIEGGCASGKTTLAKILEDVYGSTTFQMDDYFLRPEQRTEERFAEIGGNVDRERFEEEILKPLSENKNEICYRSFNCLAQSLEAPVCVVPNKLVVIEGVYSMHPSLSDYYDYSVYLEIDSETRKARILKRNSPKMAERFFNEWIPLEETYFREMNVKERCDLIINN